MIEFHDLRVQNPILPGKAIVINHDLCCGCNSCVNVCRTDVLVPDLKPASPAIGRDAYRSPCEAACPAGIDIRRQLAYIANGQYAEALAVIRESIALPLVCGRICPRFCETQCRCTPLGGPVRINMTKRFVADRERLLGGAHIPERKPATGRKVAIIGSGPAGVSAAYYMGLEGHLITLFEASPKIGGMLRYGVPDHRLAKDVVDIELEPIIGLCAEIKTNYALGKDFTLADLKAQGFEAIFLAIGAQGLVKLGVDGEDMAGVLQALKFLKDINSGSPPNIGQTVVVGGGGAVAIDAAQCAVRLGATAVKIVALEARDKLPAARYFSDDVVCAEEEGVEIIAAHGVRTLIGMGGRITGLELQFCISTVDSLGKFNPQFDDNQRMTLPADTVILALGETVEMSALGGTGLEGGRALHVDEASATKMPGIFAAGDVVTGSRSVVEEIAGGRRAAVAMGAYLKGLAPAMGRDRATFSAFSALAKGLVVKPEVLVVEPQDRAVMPLLSAAERKQNFHEIELGIGEQTAMREAGRCLQCSEPPAPLYADECWFCGVCVEHCPIHGAITVEHPLNQRVGWKRKDTGELFRIGMKNPPAPNTRPASPSALNAQR
jgi:formate dehydrogenase major subunit